MKFDVELTAHGVGAFIRVPREVSYRGSLMPMVLGEAVVHEQEGDRALARSGEEAGDAQSAPANGA